MPQTGGWLPPCPWYLYHCPIAATPAAQQPCQGSLAQCFGDLAQPSSSTAKCSLNSWISFTHASPSHMAQHYTGGCSALLAQIVLARAQQAATWASLTSNSMAFWAAQAQRRQVTSGRAVEPMLSSRCCTACIILAGQQGCAATFLACCQGCLTGCS